MTDNGASSDAQTILVVGGGMAGMTAAIQAAECGQPVLLIEKAASLGGQLSALSRLFASEQSPLSRLERCFQRIRALPNLQVRTLTEVLEVGAADAASEAAADNAQRVVLREQPRFVNANCTACGDCARVAHGDPAEADIGLPQILSYPQRYRIDARTAQSALGKALADACRFDAIDLQDGEQTWEIRVGAIIWAAGSEPYEAARIHAYRYAQQPDVISAQQFERLADLNGPTGGRVLRPSDGREARNIAFIQCAGSLDERHLRHCSQFCCAATLKQAAMLRERHPDDGHVTVYHLDIRGIGDHEAIYQGLRRDAQVRFVRSRVAEISAGGVSTDALHAGQHPQPVCHGVDTASGRHYRAAFDLVVLAVGAQPVRPGIASADSVIVAGSAQQPGDLDAAERSGKAAALQAIQRIAAIGETAVGETARQRLPNPSVAGETALRGVAQ